MNTVAAVDITTWQQAVEAFPCPSCTANPGIAKEGYGPDGALYSACPDCQPHSISEQFMSLRRGCGPKDLAANLATPFPVRFQLSWDAEDRPVITDRVDGSSAWTGERAEWELTGSRQADQADRMLRRLNLQWWLTLHGHPERLL